MLSTLLHYLMAVVITIKLLSGTVYIACNLHKGDILVVVVGNDESKDLLYTIF